MKKWMKVSAITIGVSTIAMTAIVAPLVFLTSQNSNSIQAEERINWESIRINPNFLKLATDVVLRKEFERVVFPDEASPVLFNWRMGAEASEDSIQKLFLVKQRYDNSIEFYDNKIVDGISAIEYLPFILTKSIDGGEDIICSAQETFQIISK